ncbi:MAG: phosphoglycolate phosphatase [Gammaproteobacteria bacterium]|jgi:phosphoglycolate phosphatase
MNDSARKAVLFDLDGTLVDSAPDLAASVTHALATIGMPAPGLEEIRTYIGAGAQRLVHRALTRDPDGVADDTVFSEASRLFFDHYAENLCVHSCLYPGVVATLNRLQRRGCRFACVTNKPARYTALLLEAVGLSDYFAVCVSGDSLPRKKPDPAPLQFAAATLGVAAADCTMVGDTATDIAAARNAGMKAIAVDYGYGKPDTLVAASPDRIVSAFAELAEFLPVMGTGMSARKELRT